MLPQKKPRKIQKKIYAERKRYQRIVTKVLNATLHEELKRKN